MHPTMLDRKISKGNILNSKGKNLNYSPNYFNHPRSTKKVERATNS
jgi:hypothetical protein